MKKGAKKIQQIDNSDTESFHYSLISMSNDNIDQTVSTRFFQKQPIRQPKAKTNKKSMKAFPNFNDIGVDDFLIKPVKQSDKK